MTLREVRKLITPAKYKTMEKNVHDREILLLYEAFMKL